MTSPTPTSAGWFDDPDDSEQLRYFDGIVWTSHTTPRRTRWDAPPTTGASETAMASPPPHVSPAGPYAAPPLPTAAAAYGGGPTTPDGVPLASYGQRVVAYLIDNVVVGVLSMIFGAWFLIRAFAPVWSQMEAAAAANDQAAMQAAVESVDQTQMVWFAMVSLLVAIGYHLFFLTRWSATPGKLLMGISVRALNTPGVLPMALASRRVSFEAMITLLGNLPLVGLLAVGLRVLDLLWPLRDPQRQTWHDKFAGTVVVKGRQQR